MRRVICNDDVLWVQQARQTKISVWKWKAVGVKVLEIWAFIRNKRLRDKTARAWVLSQIVVLNENQSWVLAVNDFAQFGLDDNARLSTIVYYLIGGISVHEFAFPISWHVR